MYTRAFPTDILARKSARWTGTKVRGQVGEEVRVGVGVSVRVGPVKFKIDWLKVARVSVNGSLYVWLPVHVCRLKIHIAAGMSCRGNVHQSVIHTLLPVPASTNQVTPPPLFTIVIIKYIS